MKENHYQRSSDQEFSATIPRFSGEPSLAASYLASEMRLSCLVMPVNPGEIEV